MPSLSRWLMTSMILMLVLSVLGGCQMFGTDSDTSTSSAAAEEDASQQAEAEAEEEEIVYDPQVGMTKDEILAMYRGEPDHRSISSDGTEIWRYHVNAGEAWIPFNFGYRPRFHEIHFNDQDEVERYVTD